MLVNCKANQHLIGRWLWSFLFCFCGVENVEVKNVLLQQINNKNSDNNNSCYFFTLNRTDGGKISHKMTQMAYFNAVFAKFLERS